MKWYQLETSAVFSELKTCPEGFTAADVEEGVIAVVIIINAIVGFI